MATGYRRQAIRGAVPVVVAAAIVFALGFFGFAPSAVLVAAFVVATVVLLGGWYALDRPWYLRAVWIVPATVAAVLLLSGDAPSGELRSLGVAVAGLGVVTVVISPFTAYAAEMGESVGNRFTDDD